MLRGRRLIQFLQESRITMVLGENAWKMFDKMPERNVISWSCMMDAYVRCGECKEVLALLREMQRLDGVDVRPNNEFMMSVMLLACVRLGAPEHFHTHKKNYVGSNFKEVCM